MIKAIDFLPVWIAFAAGAVSAPFVVPFLRSLKLSQTERQEGVKSHLKKAGTPTMGGVMILGGILLVFLIYVWKYPLLLPAVVLTAGFGAVGFLDDYRKVVKHDSDGLLPKQKLALQFVITAVFLLLLTKVSHVPLTMRVPFTAGKMLDLGLFAVPFAFIVILATVNGVNFTDGLDGLASSVTAVVAVFFTAAAWILKAGITPLTLAVVGALMAFLLSNAYPAKVFMGDTGSLALGGFVAASAYVLQMPLYIPVIGLIYTVELLSVVIQVSYFKATHGKRIFKMTPIHHHFELSGWSETRIVTVFTVVTVLCALLALIGLL